jgi:hypothetical protein
MQKRLLAEGSPSTSRLDPLLELIVKKDMKVAKGRFPLISDSQMDKQSRFAEEPFEI